MKKFFLLISAGICAASTFMAVENGAGTAENQDARARKKIYCIYTKMDAECVLGEGEICLANIVNGKCEDLVIKPEE